MALMEWNKTNAQYYIVAGESLCRVIKDDSKLINDLEAVLQKIIQETDKNKRLEYQTIEPKRRYFKNRGQHPKSSETTKQNMSLVVNPKKVTPQRGVTFFDTFIFRRRE